MCCFSMRHKEKYLQSERQSEKYKVYLLKLDIVREVLSMHEFHVLLSVENTGRCCMTNMSSSLVTSVCKTYLLTL